MLTLLAIYAALALGGLPKLPVDAPCDSIAVVAGLKVWDLLRHVEVKRTDLVLPVASGPCVKVVWQALRTEQSLTSFRLLEKIPGYTEDGEDLRRYVSQAMVDSAKVKGLPSESLALCLAPERNPGLRYIPIAAYLARADTSLIWIVVKKTAIKAYNKTGFVAFRVEDNSVLCGDNTW